jgi:hypothetical protein
MSSIVKICLITYLIHNKCHVCQNGYERFKCVILVFAIKWWIEIVDMKKRLIKIIVKCYVMRAEKQKKKF